MRAEDVKYTETSSADHSYDLEMLDTVMNLSNFSNVQKVTFTVLFRMAIDRAYNAGMKHGF